MSDANTEVILPPRPSKMVPMLLGINSVALVGVLAVVMLRGSGNTAKASEPAAAEATAESGAGGSKTGPTLKLQDFTARLHSADADRYARVSIELEVATDKDKEELALDVPRIRDNFISYLSDLTLDDLSGSQGLARTKEKLNERLQTLVPPKRVRALYITDLVIQ